MTKPRLNSESERQLQQAAEKFDAFQEGIKSLNMDQAASIPLTEVEPNTQLSQREIRKAPDIYLKPKKTMFAPGEKFNEKFRDLWDYKKEIVRFIAENKEAPTDAMLCDVWTRPIGGQPAHSWDVPLNKPVWGPRYLAEQIRAKVHNKLVIKEGPITQTQGIDFNTQMAYLEKKPRLSAEPCREEITVGGFKSAFN